VFNSSETFFRASEVQRETRTLPADIFNRCRRLLGHAERGSVFVPIRSMQYLAVIDAEEVIFVDSQGRYQVVEGEGGRPILLSWRFPPPGERESITEPVALEVIYYYRGLEDVQRRLVGEFAKALSDLEDKDKDPAAFEKGAKIISLQIKS